jgi:general secretion pathway protein H
MTARAPSSAVIRSRAQSGARARARLAAGVGRSSSRGMTLIEILIVMAIIAVVLGGVLAGSGQLASSRLHHASTTLAGAIRVGYTHATATSKSVRLVLDLDEQTLWLEEADRPMLVQSKDTSPSGGAEAATDAEKLATAETDRIVKGPVVPKASFKAIDPIGVAVSAKKKGPKPLDRGIAFRSVQTAHDDAPRTQGRAYIYFWPGGRTERATIQLFPCTVKTPEDRTRCVHDDAITMTVQISPLTGKVTAKDGAVDLAKAPGSDEEASERVDTGGTP